MVELKSIDTLRTPPTLQKKKKVRDAFTSHLHDAVSSADKATEPDNAHGALLHPCQKTTSCKSTLFNNSNGLDQYLLLEASIPLWTRNRLVSLWMHKLPSASVSEDQFTAELCQVFSCAVNLVSHLLCPEFLSVKHIRMCLLCRCLQFVA